MTISEAAAAAEKVSNEIHKYESPSPMVRAIADKLEQEEQERIDQKHMTVLEQLEKLSNEGPQPQFNIHFERELVSLLIHCPDAIIRSITNLKPDHFADNVCKLLFATIMNYYEKYQLTPTEREVYIALDLRENDPDCKEIIGYMKTQPDPKRFQFIKDGIEKWRIEQEQQVLKRAICDAIAYDQMAEAYDLTDKLKAVGLDDGDYYEWVGCNSLIQKEIKYDWLVDHLLRPMQPTLVGGKDKCLKTSMTCDLAVSLATGSRFLGYFDIPVPKRVMFFSAESGEVDIQGKMAILQASRKPDPILLEENLSISFVRPCLSNPDELIRLSKAIKKKRGEVVIIDPLYLTLLAGDDSGAKGSDMYAMGGKFGALSDVITKAGATPILVHHYKKTTDPTVLGLQEFTFTGASSFARQSLHIGRRLPYTSPQTNQMCFEHHGNKNSGRYTLDINEDDWSIRMESATEAEISAEVNQRVSEDRKLTNYLTVHGPSFMSNARAALGWNPQKFARVVDRNRKITLNDKNQYYVSD